MAEFFWVGEVDSDPTDAGNWSDTSGGAGGFGVPGSADTVTFQANGGVGNADVDYVAPVTYGTMSVTNYSGTFHLGANITISTVNPGGEILRTDASGVTWTGSGKFIVSGDGDLTLTASGAAACPAIDIAGDVRFITGDPVVAGALRVLTGGSLDFNSRTSLNAAGVVFQPGATVTMAPASPTINCATFTSAVDLSATPPWQLVVSGATSVTAGTIVNSDASGSASPINATVGTAVDGGGNTNWNFPAPPPSGGTARAMLSM